MSETTTLTNAELGNMTGQQIAQAVRDGKIPARKAADFLLARADAKIDRAAAKAAKLAAA